MPCRTTPEISLARRRLPLAPGTLSRSARSGPSAPGNLAATRLASLARVGNAAVVVKKTEGPVAAALFDVDGTLVDTNYLHAVTWWEAFDQAGYQVPMAQIHRAIGMGSGQMLDMLLPGDRNKDADADVRTAHSALYATY
jgi:hypothetical protein